MDFITLAKSRYSVRHYSERQIEKDKLDKILEVAELGLGSVWVDGFPNTKTAEVFHLPKSVKLVCLMSIGYAATNLK
nr:nitroreductase family protein [uncultured Oribacterium sp.]